MILRKNKNYMVEKFINRGKISYLFTEFIIGTLDFIKYFDNLEDLNNFVQNYFDWKIKPIKELTLK